MANTNTSGDDNQWWESLINQIPGILDAVIPDNDNTKPMELPTQSIGAKSTSIFTLTNMLILIGLIAGFYFGWKLYLKRSK